MEDFLKEVSYIKGYADALNINEISSDGKLTVKIINVIDKMAEKIEELNNRVNELECSLDIAEETIDDLEDYIYDIPLGTNKIEDDEDDDDDDFDLFDDFEDDDMGHFEVQCPHCMEDVMVDFETLDMNKSMICPNCHEEIEFEFEYDDDCDCDDCHSCDDTPDDDWE